MAERDTRLNTPDAAIIYADFDSLAGKKSGYTKGRMTLATTNASGDLIAVDIEGGVSRMFGNNYFTPKTISINGENAGEIKGIHTNVILDNKSVDGADGCDIAAYCKKEPALMQSINALLANNPGLIAKMSFGGASTPNPDSTREAAPSDSARFVPDDSTKAFAHMMSAIKSGGYVEVPGSLKVETMIDGKKNTIELKGSMTFIGNKGRDSGEAYFRTESLIINGKNVSLGDYSGVSAAKFADVDMTKMTFGQAGIDVTKEYEGGQWKGALPGIVANAIKQARTMPAEPAAQTPPATRYVASPAPSMQPVSPAPGLNTPELTSDDRAFIQAQIDSANNKMREDRKSKNFMPIIIQEAMEDVEKKLDRYSFKRGKDENDVTVRIENETWRVNDVYRDNTDKDHPKLILALSSTSNPDKTMHFRDADRWLNNDTFASRIQSVNRDYDSRQQDAASAQTYDISRTNPVASLTFSGFDEKDNKTFSRMIRRAEVMPGLLRDAGYNMVTDQKDWKIQQFGENPKEEMAARIQTLRDKGVKDFHITILAHGMPDSSSAKYTDKKAGWETYALLTDDNMKEIFKEFPDCRFTIDTVACFGGGLSKAAESFVDAPDAQPGRIGAITQTKSYQVNSDAGYGEIRLKLVNDMAARKPGAPKTYGEAHIRADDQVRDITEGERDPEFIKSQPGKKSLRTALNDRLVDGNQPIMAGVTFDGEATMPRRGGMVPPTNNAPANLPPKSNSLA